MDTEKLDTICDGLVIGRSLRTMLVEVGASNGSFYRFIEADKPAAEQYTRARERQGDFDADQVTDVAQKVAAGEIPPDAARVIIDAHKWSAGKRKPKAYGERVTHAGDPEAPIHTESKQTIDVTGLNADQLRALASIKVPAG